MQSRSVCYVTNFVSKFLGTTENGDSWDCYPLTEEGRKNVVGMEACLWSEEVVEERHIWEQMFPRVFALAQRSWAETTWEETTGSSWDIFKNTTFKADWLRFRYALQFKLRELEQDGMWYDLPKPGMKEVGSNSWSFNTLYYHNPVMFRNPNSTDKDWKPYSIVKGRDSFLAHVTTVVKRKSRTMMMIIAT